MTEIGKNGEILHLEESVIVLKDFTEGKKVINLTIRDGENNPVIYLECKAIKKLDIEDGVIKKIELLAQYDKERNYVVLS